MSETLTFPDVSRALIPYLTARLASRSVPAYVGGRIPTTRPTRLVRVTQVGGSWVSISRAQPLVLVECYDKDDSSAYDLAALCLAEIEAATRNGAAIAAGVWIGAQPDDFSLPVNFPDPLTSLPRFQFTCSLTTNAHAL